MSQEIVLCNYFTTLWLVYEKKDLEKFFLSSTSRGELIRKIDFANRTDGFLSTEKPKNIYGVKALFAFSFIRSDMEDAFMEVSREFLRKEPRINSERKNELFSDLSFPLDVKSKINPELFTGT